MQYKSSLTKVADLISKNPQWAGQSDWKYNPEIDTEDPMGWAVQREFDEASEAGGQHPDLDPDVFEETVRTAPSKKEEFKRIIDFLEAGELPPEFKSKEEAKDRLDELVEEIANDAAGPGGDPDELYEEERKELTDKLKNASSRLMRVANKLQKRANDATTVQAHLTNSSNELAASTRALGAWLKTLPDEQQDQAWRAYQLAQEEARVAGEGIARCYKLIDDIVAKVS